MYNTILKGTPTGQEAGARYDGATDKSDHNALDRLAPLRVEAENDASQEHATYIELDDLTEPPENYIELDDPPTETGTYIELDPTEPPENYIEPDTTVDLGTGDDLSDPDIDMHMGGHPR
ncbi:hypothetical protein L1785_09215 [Antribacter sp. KLBMP9083]|uniref:Uncharacterized protein n=1 Tax=Antribacter soli TaxID=2910976 RepID=A0AA41QEI3_9MICO|nr:hypothetical protein [Antribacter soli]MCF4121161.1 hypothetical protein [Antribacter soli]